MIAVQESHEKIVEILLEANADVRAPNKDGLTARNYSNCDSITLMLANSANSGDSRHNS